MFAVPANAVGYSISGCPEAGRHYRTGNVRSVFVASSIPKSWVDPGVEYAVSKGTGITYKGSVTGGLDLKFVADIARVSINATIEYNKTTTLTQTWKWKNTTNKTQWAQLGMKGYTFDVYSYDVSSSCSITNQQWAGTGTMPTREYWLRHSSY